MMNYHNNKKSIRFYLFIVLILGNCGIFPNDTEQNQTDNMRNVEVAIKPDSKTLQVNESFLCSLYVQSDTSLIAAKFQLHFNPQLLQFTSAESTSTSIQFFDDSCDSGRNPADLAIQIAATDLLPVNTACVVMNFKALNLVVQDSIYFEKAVYWTSLRDTLNRSVFIDHFKSLKYSIR